LNGKRVRRLEKKPGKAGLCGSSSLQGRLYRLFINMILTQNRKKRNRLAGGRETGIPNDRAFNSEIQVLLRLYEEHKMHILIHFLNNTLFLISELLIQTAGYFMDNPFYCPGILICCFSNNPSAFQNLKRTDDLNRFPSSGQ